MNKSPEQILKEVNELLTEIWQTNEKPQPLFECGPGSGCPVCRPEERN